MQEKLSLQTPDHGSALVDFENTNSLCASTVIHRIKSHSVVITQGFIKATIDKKTTTLGREGSDYSASILAAGIGAKRSYYLD